MKVAVTGATGHLGGCIVRELHQRHHTIRALVRGNTNDFFDGIPIEFIKGDLDHHEALKGLLMSCDALIHSAALISIQGDPKGILYKTNVEGTRNIMEAAKASGIKRVIHISSIHAYQQEPIFELLDEHREKVKNDDFAYNRSKKEGEEIALSYASGSMEVVVVQPTSIVGPFDLKPSKMGKAIINICSGKIPFIFNAGYDFCDGRDVSSAIVNALMMGTNGESYLLGGKWSHLKELAKLLCHISGKKNEILVIPLFLGWLGLPFIQLHGWLSHQDPLYTNEALKALQKGNHMISSEKAKKELQYTPRPLEETLRDTFEWFTKNGYLG